MQNGLEGARSVPRLTHAQGSVLVVISGAIFSFGALAFRLTDDITAWSYLMFRGLGALLSTLPIFAIQHRGRLRATLRNVAPSHVLAGVVLGCLFSLFVISLSFASTAFVLFFQPTTPIAAAVFSWLLLRERFSRDTGIATAMVMVGVFVMIRGSISDDFRAGALLAALLPIGFGLYSTLIRRARQIDPSVPVIVAGATAALAGLLGSLVEGDGTLNFSMHDALIGLFAGSVLLGLALPVFNTAQRVVPSPEASLLILSEVVLAPIWVWIFVSERPNPATVVGGVIMMLAIVWLTWRRRAGALAAALTNA